MILSILGRRGDRTALPPVLAALRDADESVRLAAISAAAELGSEETVKALVATLDSERESERQAVQQALRHMTGKGINESLAASLAAGSARQKQATLSVLATRAAVAQLSAILTA